MFGNAVYLSREELINIALLIPPDNEAAQKLSRMILDLAPKRKQWKIKMIGALEE